MEFLAGEQRAFSLLICIPTFGCPASIGLGPTSAPSPPTLRSARLAPPKLAPGAPTTCRPPSLLEAQKSLCNQCT